LKRVVTFLDGQRADYMITGSYATSLMGAPRATHDLDVVVVPFLKANPWFGTRSGADRCSDAWKLVMSPFLTMSVERIFGHCSVTHNMNGDKELC
jgi:hypothetical protein